MVFTHKPTSTVRLDNRAFIAGQEHVATIADSLRDVFGVSWFEPMLYKLLAKRLVLNV